MIAFLCPFQPGGKTSDRITAAVNLNKRNVSAVGKQPLTSVKPQNITNLSNALRIFFLQLPLLLYTSATSNFPPSSSAVSWEFCGSPQHCPKESGTTRWHVKCRHPPVLHPLNSLWGPESCRVSKWFAIQVSLFLHPEMQSCKELVFCFSRGHQVSEKRS